MRQNPTNASLRVNSGAGSSEPASRDWDFSNYAAGREALQALLAFSSLHQQIRQRRNFQGSNGSSRKSWETWEPERFVLDEVLHLVSQRALAITGADGVAIALAEGDEILCRASAGSMAPDPGAHLDPNSGFSGYCLRTGVIVRCDNAERDPRVDAEACRRLGLRSIVAVPLLTQHGAIGLLAAFCAEPFGFNDSDVRGLSLLAELILAALQPEEDFVPHGEPLPKAVMPPAATVERPPQSNQVTAPVIAAKPMPPIPQPPMTQAPMTQPTISRSPDPVPLTNVETLRDALAPVTHQSGQPAAPAPQELTSFADYENPKRSRLGLIFAVVLGLLAVAGSGAYWWEVNHKPGAATTASSTPGVSAENEAASQADRPESASPASSNAGTESPAEKNGPQPQLTGIRHWSAADSSTVAIDLQDQVQYEAHRLSDPERIYFDLHETGLASGVPSNIEVGDELLVRIRVAQPTPGVTRVVLETKKSPNFSVSLESNPYRLVVEVRSIGAKTEARKKINLFRETEQFLAARKAPDSRLRAEVRPGAPVFQKSARIPATRFRIVLDAGHGGWDMGTVGQQGLLEKDLVLDIVARVGNLIEKRLGAEVIYTRQDDTYISLEKRTEIANTAQADMFLSVHANYSDLRTARGVETYYTNTFSSEHARTHDPDEVAPTNVSWNNVDIRGKAQDSRRFASEVQHALYHGLAAQNPGLRDRGVKQASYVVLTGTTMPAVLAEVSFVSSPRDETSLHRASYRQKIAEALCKGVIEYATSLHRNNLISSLPGRAGQ